MLGILIQFEVCSLSQLCWALWEHKALNRSVGIRTRLGSQEALAFSHAAWQGRKVTYGPEHRATLLSAAKLGSQLLAQGRRGYRAKTRRQPGMLKPEFLKAGGSAGTSSDGSTTGGCLGPTACQQHLGCGRACIGQLQAWTL